MPNLVRAFARSFVLVPVVALAACSAAPSEEAAQGSSSIVSSTRTFLVPVDPDARTACRAEVNSYYCDSASTAAATARCLAKIGSSDPAAVRAVTVSEPCAGSSQPTYPDRASCQTPRFRNCSFYSACVDAVTPCGESGYALGYGEKYCTAFENVSGLSARGVSWRDDVMLCLQQTLVPFSSATSQATCDQILETAFDSHPRCYTRPENSICFLPPSDSLSIVRTIGGTELLTARSRKQILATIGTCIGQIGRWLLPFHVASDASLAPANAAIAPTEIDAPPGLSVEELRALDAFWKGLEVEYQSAAE